MSIEEDLRKRLFEKYKREIDLEFRELRDRHHQIKQDFENSRVCGAGSFDDSIVELRNGHKASWNNLALWVDRIVTERASIKAAVALNAAMNIAAAQVDLLTEEAPQ